MLFDSPTASCCKLLRSYVSVTASFVKLCKREDMMCKVVLARLYFVWQHDGELCEVALVGHMLCKVVLTWRRVFQNCDSVAAWWFLLFDFCKWPYPDMILYDFACRFYSEEYNIQQYCIVSQVICARKKCLQEWINWQCNYWSFN